MNNVAFVSIGIASISVILALPPAIDSLISLIRDAKTKVRDRKMMRKVQQKQQRENKELPTD
jgi:hypothetical protein